MYLCVWDGADWWKREWGAVGWKKSWRERSATHAPSQGQGGATHPSTQGERGTADAPTQSERVLEAGVDTWQTAGIKSVEKIFHSVFLSEVLRPQKRSRRSCTHEIDVKVGQEIYRFEMCSIHTNLYLGQSASHRLNKYSELLKPPLWLTIPLNISFNGIKWPFLAPWGPDVQISCCWHMCNGNISTL